MNAVCSKTQAPARICTWEVKKVLGSTEGAHSVQISFFNQNTFNDANIIRDVKIEDENSILFP